MNRRLQDRLSRLLLAAGASCLLIGAYAPGKSALALTLIARAEARGPGSNPWPGADFRVFGRLEAPRLHIRQVLLDQDQPRVLAFGPGRAYGQNPDTGLVFSAHRDSHFAWLQDARLGEPLVLVQNSARYHFRIAEFKVVNIHETRLLAPAPGQLILTTCWPLDAWQAGSAQRLVVRAALQPERVQPAEASGSE